MKSVPPNIRVILDPETMKRIETGPLAVTKGRGKASWVRTLISRELNRIDQANGLGDGSGNARELADYLRQRCPAAQALQGMVEGGA